MKKILLLLLLCATMMISAFSQPVLSEGFENSSFPPAGWTVAGTSYTNWNSTTLQKHSGTSSVYHRYQVSGNGYLITPQLTLNSNSILSFYVATDFNSYAWATTFTVEVSTIGTDLASFTPVHTVVTPSANNTFELVEIDLSAFTGEQIYVAFHIVDNDGTGYYLDDVLVDAAPTCAKPQNLEVDNTTTSTATLSWDALSNAQAYVVEYIPYGETDWSNAESMTLSESTATLTGLESGSAYTVRVKADCGSADGESQWSNTVNFGTVCESVSQLPYNCTFDNVMAMGESPLTLCWERVNNQTYPFVNTYSAMANSGENALFWTSSADGAIVLLPEIDFNSYDLTTLQVSFYGRNYNGSSQLEVGILADMEDPASFVPVYTAALTNTYKQFVAVFGDADVTDGRVALRSVNNGDYIYIDDVVVETIPDCSQPNSLYAEVSGSVVNLHWQSTGSNFNIHYKNASDEEYTVIDGVSLSESGYQIDDLENASMYNWFVTAICGDDSLSSSVESFVVCSPLNQFPKQWDFESGTTGTFPLPFCWIRKDGVNNPYCYNGGYGGGKALMFSNYDYNNPGSKKYVALPELDLTNFAISSLQLSFTARNIDGDGKLEIGLMTDPADESTFTVVETITGIGEDYSAYDITFNGHDEDGSYMAIRSVPTSEDDYSDTYIDNVTIELVPTCLRPTELAVSDITTDGAVLHWTSDASEYNLYYKAAGEEFAVVENISSDESGYALNGLVSGTTYEWYVEALCGDGTAPASVHGFFTTVCESVQSNQLPYSMGFEGLQNYTLPNCWTQLESSTDYFGAVYPSVYNHASYTHSGSGSLKFSPYVSQGKPNVVALPNIDEEIHALRMTFYMRPGNNTSTYGSMQIGLMSDLDNANSFELVRNVVASELDNSSYTKYTVLFDTTVLEGNSNHIVFRCLANSGSNWYVDDIVVDYITECAEPVNLSATELTSTSAKLSWTGGMDYYRIFYKKNNEENYDSLDVTLEDGYFVLEDLEPSTKYNWFVKVECDGESLSSSVKTFTTLCLPQDVLPLTWDFETNNTGGSGSYYLPQCWMRVSGNFPYSYNSASNAYQGSRILYWGYSHSGTAVLPPFNTEQYPINSLYVSFVARAQYSTPSAMIVGVMSDVTDVETFEPVLSIVPTTQYQNYIVPLESYNGEGKFIALKYENNLNYLYVDSLTLGQMPECSQPIQLSASPRAVSAVLSWSSTAEEFVLYTKDESSTEYMETEVVLDENGEYELVGLQPSTTYSWYVAAVCDDGLVESNTVETFTTLCLPVSADSLPYEMDFENTALYTIPACWTLLDFYSSSYSSIIYPFTYQSPTYSHGGSRCLHMMPYMNSGRANIFALPMIDAEINDLDLEFFLRPMSNSSEYGRVEIGVMSNLGSPESFELVETIVATDFEGPVYQKFRVSFENTQLSGNDNFIVFRCYNQVGLSWFLDDIVVDYRANCLSPENLQVDSVGEDFAVLSWTGNTDDYRLYYKGLDEEVFNMLVVSLDEEGRYVLEDLEPSNIYTWYVVSVCTEEEDSDPSNTKTFATECLPIVSLPKTWDFTGDNNGGTQVYPLPMCWNRISANGYPFVYEYVQDSYLAFDLYYKGTYAVLPRIDNSTYSLSDLSISMNAALQDGGYQGALLEVGVMTDPLDASTFTLVNTVNTFNNAPQDIEVSFENYTGEGDYIAIRTSPSVMNYDVVYVYELSVFERPDCAPVDNLVVTDVTTNSVEVTWIGENEGGFVIEYKEASADEWTMTGTTASNSYTIGSLQSGVSYSVRVAPVCEGVVMYRTLDVMTLCEVVNEFPYNESFESGDLGCWYNETLAGNHEWEIYESQYVVGYTSDGNYSVTFTYHPGSSARLVSPTFDLSAMQNPVLRYDYYAGSYQNVCDTMGVYYRTSPAMDWTYLSSNPDNGGNASFATYTVELPDPNASYQIMFFGAGMNGYGIYLDNINIMDTIFAEECMAPTALAVSGQTQNTANVTWTAGGNETSWKLQYKLASENGWVNPEV
ncbi:MAG: fibronectin type III domain-containing protein, partial [Bacteroidales bacterium]|nr:fibronectin type III domain-containing protein [Bacteroidales bacterium]